MIDTTSSAPGPELGRGMAMLDQAMGILSNVDVSELPGEGLGEVALTLAAHSRQLAATHAAVSDRFATSGAWADDAARTAGSWFAGRTNDTRASGKAAITLGRHMRTHPLMGAAFQSGQVTAGHLRALASIHRRFPSLTSHLSCAEADLVDLAVTAEPQRFHQLLLDLCHRVDPGAVERDEEARRRDHFLHLSTLMHGEVKLDGLLPADLGAQFAALLAAARRKTDSDDDESTPQPGTPTELVDQRRASQVNIDGLRLVLSAAASATHRDGTIALPTVNGTRPVIHLSVNLETLLADSKGQAAAWLQTYGVPAAAISSATTRELLCDAILEPVAINARGELIATLPTSRTIPPALRKAVLLRDVVCRIPGCHRHIEEIHHVTFYRNGGLTKLDNLAGLCWFHHHLIHHGPWTLEGDSNGTLTLTNTRTGEIWPCRPPPKRE